MDPTKLLKRGAVLGLVGLALLLWIVVLTLGPESQTPESFGLPQLSLETLLAPSSEKGTALDQPQMQLTWGRDPFVFPYNVTLQSKPAVEETQGAESAEQAPNLTAILISGSNRLAVIDELVVGEGDLVRGDEIVSIASDKVILSGPGGHRVLQVPEPQTRIRSGPAGSENPKPR